MLFEMSKVRTPSNLIKWAANIIANAIKSPFISMNGLAFARA